MLGRDERFGVLISSPVSSSDDSDDKGESGSEAGMLERGCDIERLWCFLVIRKHLYE